MKKERVDILATQQGLAESRERAKRLIMAGEVVDSNGQRYDKPGEKIPVETLLHLKGKGLRYVSRGGLKLEKAMASFDVEVEGKTLLDIGASTGGFTDAALQHGAKKSYALDVGYNQLAWKLRQDPRVIVMERVNFRYATKDMFTEGQADLVSIDVSFISLDLIFPPLKSIASEGADVLALIKPQFEAGKDLVGKNGIVRDPLVHEEVLRHTIEKAREENLYLVDLTYSPITGGSGNIEFLGHFILKTSQMEWNKDWDQKIVEVVKEAHENLLHG
ncbi:TlyA family RNA methyltransferase [Atopobacter sp. AH10]|uniref:TlyA family RNA methyltransferase n=1 Tax=Atopobacter sp. AH10 TaxID=2315861 RepID=UPI000EF18AFA|nr:TlyA family RNA methyltransferase [Atopobacter sp. AH10]RLK62525.1 TlyA family RNA methyltransferase [Atopobacter sp. AH10]